MTKGRIEEAKKLLQKAAATNKRSLPPGLLEQVLGGFLSSDTALGLAAAPGAQLTPQTSLHSHWGWFGRGLQGTPAPAELHRDKAREEAELLLRLSLELSGVHLGIWEGLKCFPGFCPVRIPGL